MNYIFDIGNVLVDFKPRVFVGALFSGAPFADELTEVIFSSREWVSMDIGLVSPVEVCEILCERTPWLEGQIRFVFQNIMGLLTPKSDTIELLPVIKNSGHRLYYLSNIFFEARDYILREYRFLDQFDGGVFSCDINMIKPDEGIYLHLLSKYGLSPDECLFFDDVQANVDAAGRLGIRAVLFDEYSGRNCAA